ncbi:hypothetical protein [Puia sp.]|uniref:hypothetical protein n=1 Tax=Puia sp. TaxID=2045100 RepID=UPI002F3F6B6A
MKRTSIFLTLLTGCMMLCRPAHAQFLKNVLNSVKQTAQNRANDKASTTTNKAIDKVDPSAPKPATPTPPAAAGKGPTPPAGDPPSTSGYVRVAVSTNKTIVGSTVKITGFSPINGSLKTVVLTVSGPVPAAAVNIPLKDSGSFSTLWVPAGTGEFRLVFKTADGKAQTTVTISAYPFQELDQITGPTRELVVQAAKKVDDAIERVTGDLTGPDATALEKTKKDFDDKTNAFKKWMDDIDQAGTGLDGLEKKYGNFPTPLQDKFTQMSDDFSDESKQLQDFNGRGDGGGTGGTGGTSGTGATGGTGGPSGTHQSYDNTICEYLAMVSEACAAFSTMLNFETNIVKLVGGIAGDKGGTVAGGDYADAAGAGDNTKIVMQEAGKLFGVAAIDGNEILSMKNSADFCGDIVQMCTSLLMKKYCVVMDGNLQETYTCTFRNKTSDVWWQYSYTAGATISLRYPKGESGHGTIKMKGNIEGNATKFSIYTDMNQMDDFKNASKQRSRVIGICVYAPPSVPFVSSQADKATGFGAVARGIATPAYFNIPIDIDYQVDAQTMKFYVNPALVDFLDVTTKYIYCYLDIALGIPLTTRVDLPINKVQLTLGKVISQNSTFPVRSDKDNNLSITGKGTSKIGPGSAIEHNINFSFTAKSD